ncbi:MAG: hypothetical protein QOG62_689 [Thermoleophilaceae bacterium]|jgi:Tfp pilus assembly protein PilV|nr:hypothetical protein [Thermoleophilaceae bacterium]
MRRIRARLHDQTGTSLIEIIVAAFILAVGVAISITTFAQAGKTTQSATRLEQAAAIAERDIESIRSRSFAKIALTSAPAGTTDGLSAGDVNQNNPKNPDYYVSGGNFTVRSDWNDKTSSLIATEALWVNASVSPALLPNENVTVDGLTAHIYRFVTERQESCPPSAGFLDPVITSLTPLLSNLVGSVNNLINTGLLGQLVSTRLNVFCLDESNPGHADTKRVTVAVVLDSPGNKAAPTRPVWLSTIVTCPQRGAITGSDEGCAG